MEWGPEVCVNPRVPVMVSEHVGLCLSMCVKVCDCVGVCKCVTGEGRKCSGSTYSKCKGPEARICLGKQQS